MNTTEIPSSIAARMDFYLSMAPAQVHNAKAFAWFSGIPDSFFNAILHFSYREDAKKHLDDLIAKASPDNAITFFVYPYNKDLIPLLKENGFQSVGQFQSMSWNVQPVQPSGQNIQLADAQEFLSTLAIPYELEKAVVEQFAPLLKKSAAENYLLYCADKAICTGSLFINENQGLILHISTLPDHRRQGCGHAMMHFLMHRASSLGLEKLVLYCPAKVVNFYTNLGFDRECEIEIYEKIIDIFQIDS